MTARTFIIILAAFFGLSGVAMAAIGAHVAGGAIVGTAATMQLIHALAALATVSLFHGRRGEIAASVFLIGILLFAGGLYSSALGGVGLGPAAPTGGILLMVGWGLLGVAAYRKASG